MAKHRTDSTTRGLLAALPETRVDLLAAIDALGDAGVTRGEIAKAARWNPGYLSEVLKQDGKRPTAAKVVSLIGALRVLGDANGMTLAGAEAVRRVAERYGVPTQSLTNPADGPVAVAAPNFVKRRLLETTLVSAVVTPGTYAIDGQPMAGVSSTLLLVETLLARRGVQTCRLSARFDLVASKRIERSATGILGALAAAITGDDAWLADDFFAIQEAIRDRLVAAPVGFALLLDDMNDLPFEELETLKSLLRDWATRRATGAPGYASVTVWLAYTSNVREVAMRSQLLASYHIVDWFTAAEVRELAKALAPFAAASGRVGSPQSWADDVTSDALALFGGQPQLTHLYLWDRHLDGAASAPGILTLRPAGAYERHLRRLARTFAALLRPARAQEAIAELAATGALVDSVSVSDWQAIEGLGIVKPNGRWRCAYYEAHLPKAVAGSVPGTR